MRTTARPCRPASCDDLGIALFSLAFLGLAPQAASQHHILVVDERGERFGGPVEVCTVVDTQQSCRDVEAALPIALERPLQSARIEGPRHGPAIVSLERLESTNSKIEIRVPRKAQLVVSRAAEVSAYDATGPLARPLVRTSVEAGSPIWLPARPLVLSARQPRTETPTGPPPSAPDLHRVDLAPGARHDLELTPRWGWSAALRLTSAGEPTFDTRTVEVAIERDFGFAALPGFESLGFASELTVRRQHDFVFLLGARHPMIAVTLTSPELLPASIPALSASPGSFAFLEARLTRGGSIEVTATLDGEPLTGATCRIVRELVDPRADPRPDHAPRETLGEAKSTSNGRCRIDRLPPGAAVVVLELPDSDFGAVEHAVQIEDEVVSQLQLDLAPLRLSGIVEHGDEPAQGYTVSAQPIDHRLGSGRGALLSTPSNENGEYSLVLWRPGDFVLLLLDENGTPSDHRRLRIDHDEEVDWSLHASGIDGHVVDAEGRPVADATVRLSWRSGGASSRLAHTADDGSFHFTVQGEQGFAKLQAGTPSLGRSPAVEIHVTDGLEPPPVELRLEDPGTRQGRLVLADGRPAAFVQLSIDRLDRHPDPSDPFAQPVTIAVLQTDADGLFEVPAPPEVPLRLFAGGPGCPLAAHDVVGTEPPASGDTPPPFVLTCPSAPANLLVHLADPTGAPLERFGLLLRHGSNLVPWPVLERHLAHLGVPTASDGSGRLAVVALAPGDYEVHLADGTSAFDVDAGRTDSLLRRVSLPPYATVELDVTLHVRPPSR
ncbi:MAG: carboxypeptidase-like regulatory domain-containing protein [Acidobacteriota bacterium]